jgi:hypothetical protein
MKQSVWTGNTPSNPQAFITKGKQRVKQHEGLVFLNDGDEYQIELFNPTQNHILAKIKIDNTFLSGGGIVLRPGERVFLERFLDSNNKFVFRTYEVGKEAVNVGAIDNNGYIEIQFFNEWKHINYWNGGSTYTKVNLLLQHLVQLLYFIVIVYHPIPLQGQMLEILKLKLVQLKRVILLIRNLHNLIKISTHTHFTM